MSRSLIFIVCTLQLCVSYGLTGCEPEDIELEDLSRDLHKLYQAKDVKRFRKTVIERGLDVNEQNDNGQSFLHMAAKEGNVYWIELLLSLGADINRQDGLRNLPPIEWARIAGRYAAYNVLRKYGAQIIVPPPPTRFANGSKNHISR